MDQESLLSLLERRGGRDARTATFARRILTEPDPIQQSAMLYGFRAAYAGVRAPDPGQVIDRVRWLEGLVARESSDGWAVYDSQGMQHTWCVAWRGLKVRLHRAVSSLLIVDDSPVRVRLAYPRRRPWVDREASRG